MGKDSRLTYNMQDFIDSGETIDLKYQELSLIDKLKGIEFPVFNVLTDYMEEFNVSSMKIELNDEEYFKYKYRPRLLANDVYGNGELAFIILLLNNICNSKEFDKKTIKLIKAKDMGSLLTYIYNSEKSFIDSYNAKTMNKDKEN